MLVAVIILLILNLYLPSRTDIIFSSDHVKVHSGPDTAKQTTQSTEPADEPVYEPTYEAIDEPSDKLFDEEIDETVSFYDEDVLQELSTQRITGADIGDDLATLCSQGDREWNPNVVIECPVFNGGFGNIRLSLLNCLRYVIEARVSMRLPIVSRRNADDISDYLTNEHVGLEYLIDEQHLWRSLELHCPHLVIRPPDDESSRIQHLGDISPVLDMGLERDFVDGTLDDWSIPTDPTQWPPAMDDWILTMTNGTPPSPQSPVSFSVHAIMLSFPTAYDPPALVRVMSELVRPRDEVKMLAASALLQMQERFDTHIDFRNSEEPFVRDNAFIGVHLRVEKDASEANWLSYEEQLGYLKLRLHQRKGSSKHPPDTDLPDIGKTVLYVASGDEDGIATLAEEIAPVTVVTKNDLLPEGTSAGTALRKMTWDQQALVDMLVLEHSGYFIGVRDSTFSWHLALRRAAAVNWVIGGYPEYCWLDDDGEARPQRRAGCRSLLAEEEEWRDDLSALIGNGHDKPDPQWAKTVWP
ncbi:hypothetical protein CkaCkLH20_04431 [Colletotrichum karsti]|uniref:Alternative oxidase n=1 Tax=Colletotrichum karsti TaxID=1095194 RepID=A0A9P6IFP5_9PEZI|nr:uncharacterized protein CkaCkLH20_04431 [Colletotrichum karsti]KAF9877855.1 hypothetical protein CkaCkLH20_04431 [Colletotrichum karsti]